MKPIQTPDPRHAVASEPPSVLWTEMQTFVLQRLEETLSPDLLYHGVAHTRDDVLPAVERLAALAHLTRDERLLLRTAALYHDTGFAVAYRDNEQFGAAIARESLPRFGLSTEQIDTVVRLIMATAIPQRPEDPLEALLCDADLDSLGREDYLDTSLKLWRELALHGEDISLEDWYRRQIRFLGAHAYFSQEARSLRDAGKAANLQLLQRLLQDLEDAPDVNCT
jgi:predicted metal-dependent HD superfamily phosphohydrolase